MICNRESFVYLNLGQFCKSVLSQPFHVIVKGFREIIQS
jgi:hypothetical protein